MKVKGVFMGLVCLLLACEKGIDYGKLKELLLKKAPSENEVFLIISKEKGEYYPVKSGEVLQSWLSPPLSEVESAITNETPVIFWLSLISVNVPPSPYEPYEPSPPPCPNGVICGDILYSFVYAEFPPGATFPQNINEGIIAFRYEWREGQNPGTSENNYWQRISYRFIDRVPVSGTISGRVINAITGEPIERAKVYAEHSSGRNSMVAVTDANGDFSIILLRPGNNTVRAFADEFQIAEVENVVVQPNSTIDVGTIELLPIPDADAFGTIRGKVYFRDCSTPVYGVQIYGKFYKTIAYLTDSNGNQVFPSAATVYQDGSYQIGLIPPGNYQLRFRVQDLSGISRFGEQMFSPATSFVPITITQINAEGFKITNLPDVCLDNLPPHLISLFPSKTVVSPNETITINATAQDPDNDILYYYWSASDGFLGLGFSNSITWTAPSTPGTYKIKVVVNDHKGGWDSEELSIELKTWKGIGGSDTGGGISNTPGTYSTTGGMEIVRSIASDSHGNIYVTWQEGGVCAPEAEIYLKKWDVNLQEWIELGGSATGGGISNTPGVGSCHPSIAVGPDDLPVVIWTETFDIYLKKWDDNQWVELGGSASGTGIIHTGSWSGAEASLAIDSNGFIYVTARVQRGPYLSDEIYLKVWDGTEWVELGGSASGGGISNAGGWNSSPKVAVKDGMVYVAWTHEWESEIPWVRYHAIYLKYWNGIQWLELGGSASGEGVSNAPDKYMGIGDIALDNEGNPLVAWAQQVNNEWGIYLKKWDGNQWVELGGSASGTGIDRMYISGPVLAMDANGNPAVVYNSLYDSILVVYLKRWDGATWTEVAGSATGLGISGGPGGLPRVTIDPSGVLWVVYVAAVEPENMEIYVKKDP